MYSVQRPAAVNFNIVDVSVVATPANNYEDDVNIV